MFNSKKELKQRINELELTCDNLELSIEYKNDIIKGLQNKLAEYEYRLTLSEKEKTELNNVISNLMEERNQLTAKKIRRSVKPSKQNTSK